MKAIVLAAGKGKRLHSEMLNLPKVLVNAAGRPLIGYVLDNISFVPQEDTIIVTGYKKEMVMEYAKGNYKFAIQHEQLGTGHAVMTAEPILRDYDGDVMILYGDMPLFTMETFRKFAEEHSKHHPACTVMTAVVDNPLPYGRIIRDENGELVDIVEVKDCIGEQINIKELNVGVYIFDCKTLFKNLKSIKNNNTQGEYYLTDLPGILLGEGLNVNTFTVTDTEEITGVNTPEDLEYCEKLLKRRTK